MVTADVEKLARARLRSIRTTLGYSLDEIAARSNLSASTISRIETGKRTLSLDVLVPLAGALQVSLDALFHADDDDDVVIRPTQHRSGSRTTWALNRVDGRTMAMKMRLEPEAALLRGCIRDTTGSSCWRVACCCSWGSGGSRSARVRRRSSRR